MTESVDNLTTNTATESSERQSGSHPALDDYGVLFISMKEWEKKYGSMADYAKSGAVKSRRLLNDAVKLSDAVEVLRLCND